MILRIKNNRDFGFSLLEVLLAMSILSMGLVGVLRAYAGSIEVLEAGQYTIEMNNLLRIKMAEIEQDILENEKLSGAASGKFEGFFEDFQWRWNVKPVVLEEREGLNEVTLTVSHVDISRTASLVTYYVEKEKEE